MKAKYQFCLVTIFAGIITFLGMNSSCAQGRDSMNVTIAFDSLAVDSIKATRDLKTGALEIRITFHNGYAASADISLSLGGFTDFGFTDEKGKKYKVYTNSHLIGTHDINKGYLNIPYIQFGDKKFYWVTMIQQQNVSQGQMRQLTVHVNHFNKGIKEIKEFHVQCILALNYAHVGDEL